MMTEKLRGEQNMSISDDQNSHLIAQTDIFLGSLVAKIARIVQSVESRTLDREVMGSNLPAVPEVTMGGHFCCSLVV